MNHPINVALVGVGNCASSLVQGLSYYDGSRAGVTPLPLIGSYKSQDIRISAAFDVSKPKVGRPLEHAIWAHPNCTLAFNPEVSETGVVVQRGPTYDGLGKYLSTVVEESDAPIVSVIDSLKDTKTDVLVNFLPVGSQEATEFYVQSALEAGCAVVNCMPVFIASNPVYAQKFRDRNIPVIGDDIKSHLGATILHRAIVQLMRDRGIVMDRTSQLNVGGNSDFQNMLERERLESKKISKTEAVTSVAGVTLAERDIHVGPSDYVPWLNDRKWAYIYVEGRGFGNAPIRMDLKLEVHDSPNSAGIVIDAIRCAKIAMDRGEGGPIAAPSAWYMKHPAQQLDDGIAYEQLVQWIGGSNGTHD